MSWLKKAIIAHNKPKSSIIEVLKRNLAGMQPGRDRTQLHASDATKEDFCPRQWALLDLKQVSQTPYFVPTALAVTFDLGLAVEQLLVERWARDAVVGNWVCQRCGDQRTMVSYPGGYCAMPTSTPRHLWKYRQVVVEAPTYDLSGGIDVLFNVGVPKLLVTECKILNASDFDTIVVPQPEHRLRTNLYLKLVADSDSPYKDQFNLHEARVLYISRGYGKKHPEWNEILPFKEFVVQRDDAALQPVLTKALQLKVFRTEGRMPAGICHTAFDKAAKKCSCCTACFSGQFPAQQAAL